MPLWKKAAKCNLISKFVSDHLHSPHKRGGSLVVETGFPTSLVDLFVKNRDRLKKPSKRKKKIDSIPDPVLTPTRPSPSSSTLATPSSSGRPNSPVVLPISQNPGLALQSVRVVASERNYLGSSDCFGNETAEIQKMGLVGDCEDGGGDGGEAVVANRVFVAILKTFFVVVLALGTKKFAVGITMSAVLLLFMEYAGKHLGWLLKPCSHAQKYLVERVFCLFGIKGGKLVVKEDWGLKALVSDCFVLIEGNKRDDPFQEIRAMQSYSNCGCSWVVEGHKTNDPFQEIQIQHPSPDLVPSTRKIQSVKYECELHSGKENWVHEEIGNQKEVMEKAKAYTRAFVYRKCQNSQREKVESKKVMEKDEACTYDDVDLKSHRSCSGKMRSKIKKLISNKLHILNKKRMTLKSEASSSSGDIVVVVMDEAKEHLEEDEQQPGLEYARDGKSLSFSSGGNRDQVDLKISCSSSELDRVEMGDMVLREDIGTQTERNSGCVIVIVIVLAGLVWGRILALAFTLSWYMLLKYAGNLNLWL